MSEAEQIAQGLEELGGQIERGEIRHVHRVNLTSDVGVNTPGMFRWGTVVFQGENWKDREVVTSALAACYSLKRHIVIGLLTGEIPYTIEGETVCFDYPGGFYSNP